MISQKCYNFLTNCEHQHRQHTLLVGRRCHNHWKMIPEDFTKEDFLKKLRRVISSHANVTIKKATCHDEPHKRYRPSADRRERHKHVALLASGNFAHKKIADAFQREHGLRISFSFKMNRFVGYLEYLMEPGKKASTDADTQPAKYPEDLNLQAELKSQKHPGEVEPKALKPRLSPAPGL